MQFQTISLVDSVVSMNDGITVTQAAIAGTIPVDAQAGDLGIAIMSFNTSSTVTPPSGWTVLSAMFANTNNNLNTVIYARDLIDGDANTAFSWSIVTANRCPGLMAVYRGTSGIAGVTVGTPTSDGVASTTIVRPAVSAVVPYSYVVGLWAMRVATAAPSPTLTYAGTETFDGRSRTAFTGSPNYTLETSHLTVPTFDVSTPEATSTATASASCTSKNSYSLALAPALLTPPPRTAAARFRAANW